MITFINAHEMETLEPKLHGHAEIHELAHTNYGKKEVQFFLFLFLH
jgi:hypothetical protein